MTQNTPGTNAGHPESGLKPQHGKVVHATDDRKPTEEKQGAPPAAGEKKGGTGGT